MVSVLKNMKFEYMNTEQFRNASHINTTLGAGGGKQPPRAPNVVFMWLVFLNCSVFMYSNFMLFRTETMFQLYKLPILNTALASLNSLSFRNLKWSFIMSERNV